MESSHTVRHPIMLLQQQLLVATAWRHVLGSRRRGCSVYGWHVFYTNWRRRSAGRAGLVGRLLYKTHTHTHGGWEGGRSQQVCE